MRQLCRGPFITATDYKTLAESKGPEDLNSITVTQLLSLSTRFQCSARKVCMQLSITFHVMANFSPGKSERERVCADTQPVHPHFVQTRTDDSCRSGIYKPGK